MPPAITRYIVLAVGFGLLLFLGYSIHTEFSPAALTSDTVVAFANSPYAPAVAAAVPAECRDPYRQPGYLYTDKKNNYKTQWIPYPETDIFDLPIPETARYPTNKIPEFTIDPPSDKYLNAGPHNWINELVRYYRLLKDIDSAKKSGGKPVELDPTQQRLVRRLNWLHGRRVLILGDSIDRIMIQEFCKALEVTPKFTEGPHGGMHTTYYCDLKLLNFTIYHWHVPSLYPMTPPWWWMPKIKIVAFEDRFKEIYAPVNDKIIGMNGKSPDLILLQSGLWDERAIRESYRNKVYPGDEKLTEKELEEVKAKRRNDELALEGRQLAWEELMFFQSRMQTFVNYVRDHFGSDPNLPMMYRGLTTRQNSNKADLVTLDMDRISRALATRNGIEIFEWASMTRGFSEQYTDYLHIGSGPLNALWSNMILYYLFRAAGGSEYNGTFLTMPDSVGHFVIEGEGVVNVPAVPLSENPDTEVSIHWAVCHPYNLHWGGR
ncbi:uncharacterized protein V2V93DRAFT_364750 [Kockiozyma suomiensis]|uniref:uncharacterized protein n=1 Tax=Kockiozyma suomiensis TaxID=1337062 RepID=UPI003343F0C9